MQVRLEGITKEFHSRKGSVKAVNNLSLQINSGKLVGFLGPSGCGKSTTLFMLAGIHDLDGGSLWFDDENVSDCPPEKRGVGMVFQNYALYPHLNVRENIAFPLVNSKSMKAKLKEELIQHNQEIGEEVTFKAFLESKIQAVAQLVEIQDYLDRKPSELSGGQQQRVAIARAMVKQPNLLLLDEPLSNLDARLRVQTREEIRRIQKITAITMVFVTHDQEEAMNICDEIAIMKEGVLQQYGPPNEIYENPHNLFVAKFLGSLPINVVEGEIKEKSLKTEHGIVIGAFAGNDQVVRIAIRPENISINPEGEFSGVITRITKNGGFSLARILMENRWEMTVLLSPGDKHREGDAVKMSLPKEEWFVFDNGGQRLWER